MRKTGVLIGALLLTLLCGCGGGTDSADNGVNTGASTEAVVKEDVTTELKATESVTEIRTEKETEAITEKETEIVTEKKTEAPTEKKTEALTEKKTEAPTEKKTEAPTEKKTEAPTEKKTEKETEAPREDPDDDDSCIGDDALVW